MPKNLRGFGDGAPAEGKDMRETALLKPGAREPASTQTGTNVLKPSTTTHKKFGKLGNRGMGS